MWGEQPVPVNLDRLPGAGDSGHYDPTSPPLPWEPPTIDRSSQMSEMVVDVACAVPFALETRLVEATIEVAYFDFVPEPRSVAEATIEVAFAPVPQKRSVAVTVANVPFVFGRGKRATAAAVIQVAFEKA